MTSPIIRSGSIKAVRLDRLHVPLSIALGLFEAATQEELMELIVDATHELKRRQDGD